MNMASSIWVSPSLCTLNAFTFPTVFGAEFTAIEASLVENFTRYVSDQDYVNNPEIFVEGVTFCNVTLAYTHPGQHDLITTESWLPIPWNGRLQAVGGGGWTAGRSILSTSEMSGAIGMGWPDATITTDAGLGHAEFPTDWALLSPGNVDIYALQNLGSVSLHDQAAIGKDLINQFYGKPPTYSYFNGCSQGGRQGIQLAQRYPDAYDGISAATPALYWPQFFQAMLWPQLVMKSIGQYPYGCELDYLQSAVIEKCDGDDGLTDGILLDPNSCEFDPLALVGTTFYCGDTGSRMKISQAAATVAKAYHMGARGPDGEFLWYGPNYGANLTRTIFGTPGLVATICTNRTCVGNPFEYGIYWTGLFAEKTPSFNFSSMSTEEYSRVFHLVAQEYASVFGTSDPDLSLFQEAGGKMISYHGLSDDICPSKGTEHYYNEVMELHPDVHSFYRHFEVPGLGHCYGGNGGQPSRLFEALREWVENGTAPDSVLHDAPMARSSRKRILCPYPEKVRVKSDDSNADEKSFYCLK